MVLCAATHGINLYRMHKRKRNSGMGCRRQCGTRANQLPSEGCRHADVFARFPTMPTIVQLLLDTAKADTELLRANDARGDVFSVPRRVDFLLRASTEGKSKLVADFIRDNQYGEVIASSDENGHRISVLITMPITQNVLCAVSGLMACVSKIFDVEYDGWGSVIQSGTPPAKDHMGSAQGTSPDTQRSPGSSQPGKN